MFKSPKTLLLFLLLAMMTVAAGCTCPPEPEENTQVYQPVTEEPNAMVATLEDAGIVIESSPVYFAFDRYDLDDRAKDALRTKADLLMQYPQISVNIEGHCDQRGTQEYNLALGERRARAAYDYLVMLGVNPSQLNMVSYGELYPAMDGNSAEAYGRNRRDEFRPSINY